MREKFFSLRPKPLERWIWQRGLPPAAERVFWLHWEEGLKRRDWCSELPLKVVARECCIDVSTVTRAYQLLKAEGLLRREDPGRDACQPFQQAIAITEVRIPRGLLVELSRAPDRPGRTGPRAQVAPSASRTPCPDADRAAPSPARSSAAPITPTAPGAGSAPPMTRAESAALMARLSEGERAAFFVASRDRREGMEFDAATVLQPEEQARVLALLRRLGTNAEVAAPPAARPLAGIAKSFGPRRLSPLEAARLRRQVIDRAGAMAGPELFRQVLWSVEEGALRRFDLPLAANIALKKIREGIWSRPHRMPPNWRIASPGTCSAA